jgi:predicted nucleic-acid-binding Zn-ribbon protein
MPVMTESEHEDLISKLPTMLRGCPSCGGSAVTFARDIIALPTLEHGVPSGYDLSDKPVAAIVVKCDSCGYLMLYRAEDHLNL